MDLDSIGFLFKVPFPASGVKDKPGISGGNDKPRLKMSNKFKPRLWINQD